MAIESEGARKVASSETYGTGMGSALNSFLFSKFNRGERNSRGSGSGRGGAKTAEDWHNEEIAKRYDAPREDYTTRRDWRLGEKSKNYDWQRSETSLDTKMNRDTFMAEEGSRRRRTDLGHAARTGAKYNAGNVTVNDGGGFSVAGGAYPLRAVDVAQPRKPKATTRQTAGTPPKPRTPKPKPVFDMTGTQTHWYDAPGTAPSTSSTTPTKPAKPTGGTTRTPAKPRGGTTKPTGGTTKPRGPKLPAADSDISITGFPHRA
jgi:hypothetical protein